MASGNLPVVKDTLIILHNGIIIKSTIDCNNLVGMLEGPLPFFTSNCLIISITSSSDT